jgi:hypothetical protein
MYAANAQQTLPAAVSEDAELLFDDVPDELDALTVKECDGAMNGGVSPEKPTAFQSCVQVALIYLLSSYFSLRQSCEAAKQYIASLLGANCSCPATVNE